MSPDAQHLWSFLPWGYALTVAIELPILLVGLSPRHPLPRRFFAGFWLTACTYPIVVLVLPPLLWPRIGHSGYLAIAETFAPAAECLLFWLVFCRAEHSGDEPQPPPRWSTLRDMAAIALANIASFLVGGWFVSRLLI